MVGYDRAFFLSQLARLLRDSATVADDARRALRAGDRETAARRLHSLKGNAGNLGALALMQTAAALEAAIQDQATGQTANKDQATDLEAGLANLECQLQDLAAASAPWLADGAHRVAAPAVAEVQAGTPVGAGSPLSPAPPDPERLAALRTALQRHDLAALDLFAALAPALAALWGEVATQALGEAIADLKFDLAQVQRDCRVPSAVVRGNGVG